MDDPVLIRREIVELRREMDATIGEIADRVGRPGRAAGAVFRSVGDPLAAMARELGRPSSRPEAGLWHDVADRVDRAARRLRGQPAASVTLALAIGLGWWVITGGRSGG